MTIAFSCSKCCACVIRLFKCVTNDKKKILPSVVSNCSFSKISLNTFISFFYLLQALKAMTANLIFLSKIEQKYWFYQKNYRNENIFTKLSELFQTSLHLKCHCPLYKNSTHEIYSFTKLSPTFYYHGLASKYHQATKDIERDNILQYKRTKLRKQLVEQQQ